LVEGVVAEERAFALCLQRRELLLGRLPGDAGLVELPARLLERRAGALRGFRRVEDGFLPLVEELLRARLPLLELAEGESEPVDEKRRVALAVRGLGSAGAGGEEVASRRLPPRGGVVLVLG